MKRSFLFILGLFFVLFAFADVESVNVESPDAVEIADLDTQPINTVDFFTTAQTKNKGNSEYVTVTLPCFNILEGQKEVIPRCRSSDVNLLQNYLI